MKFKALYCQAWGELRMKNRHVIYGTVLFGFLQAGTVWAASAPGADGARQYTHVIAQGETLGKLASRYLLRPSDWVTVAKLNGIAIDRRIPVGTRVRIPVSLMRTEAKEAKVLAAGGGVSTAAGPVAAGQSVAEGQTLRTGESGFVTLELADGSTLTLQSKSSMKLARSRQLVNTGGVQDMVAQLDSGRLETRVARQRGPASRYEISTATSNMGVRGTVFRVAADASGKRSQSEVTEGQVAAMSGASSDIVAVNAGFGTIVEAGKPPSPPRALLNPPKLSGIPAQFEKADVQVAFAPVDAATRYRGQVARDGNFANLVDDVVADEPRFGLKGLPDGKLFLRVRGIDAAGLEGQDGVHEFTVAARPFAPQLSEPLASQTLNTARVQFSWSPVAEAGGYRIQISEDETFDKPVIAAEVLGSSRYVAEQALKPVRHYWRVASVAGSKTGPWSDARPFSVRSEPPRLMAMRGSSGIMVAFGSPAQSVQVQVSRDARFNNLVADRSVSGQIDLSDLPVGAYHVRARFRQDAITGNWSAVERLEVYPVGWWMSTEGRSGR
ncbi:MAG TPA: FecR domain-containing protein [Usitatibacteraceae bacterium]|nr:FecR domain-containing protein [Usitatibacteraceae bacterium]